MIQGPYCLSGAELITDAFVAGVQIVVAGDIECSCRRRFSLLPRIEDDHEFDVIRGRPEFVGNAAPGTIIPACDLIHSRRKS